MRISPVQNFIGRSWIQTWIRPCPYILPLQSTVVPIAIGLFPPPPYPHYVLQLPPKFLQPYQLLFSSSFSIFSHYKSVSLGVKLIQTFHLNIIKTLETRIKKLYAGSYRSPIHFTVKIQ